MAKQKYGEKTQRRFLTISLGSSANITANTLTQTSVTLDKDFNRIVKIGFFETANGGAAAGLYNVQASDKRRMWIDPINVNAWKAESAVGPEEKYYDVDIPYAAGDPFYGAVIPTVNTNAALTGQMVLVLERDTIESPQ